MKSHSKLIPIHQPPKGGTLDPPLLEVMTGDLKGTRFMLSGQQISIGRDQENDIHFDSPQISRYHAALRHTDAGWEIRDLNSQNGLSVNGEKVTARLLKRGDTLRLGEIELRFEDGRSAGTGSTAGQEFFGKKNLPTSIPGEVPDPFSSAETPSYFPTAGLSQWSSPQPQRWNLKRMALWGGFLLSLCYAAYLLTSSPSAVEAIKEPLLSSSADEQSIVYADPDIALLLNPPQTESRTTEREINFVLADQLYQRGLREFQARNYRRAIDDFEASLTLYPHHQLSTMRLEEAKKKLEDAVEKNFRLGRAYLDSMKYHLAIYHFTQTLQLLADHKDSPLYGQTIQFIELSKTKMKQ
ncbi:MAG: FHA domain-containing protein [Deltaproteobacteria bacterium]|nr:FHA domain-containing protein [Deltaproteobacteria bacterium]